MIARGMNTLPNRQVMQHGGRTQFAPTCAQQSSRAPCPLNSALSFSQPRLSELCASLELQAAASATGGAAFRSVAARPYSRRAPRQKCTRMASPNGFRKGRRALRGVQGQSPCRESRGPDGPWWRSPEEAKPPLVGFPKGQSPFGGLTFGESCGILDAISMDDGEHVRREATIRERGPLAVSLRRRILRDTIPRRGARHAR